MKLTQKLIPINFEARPNLRLGVCIHTMVGTLAGTDSWFRNPAAQASSHYGVDLTTDTVYQWVKEEHVAWTQGRVSGATNKLYLERKGNPNDYFIGIENADNGNPEGADRALQLQTLAELVKDICVRNKIPVDRDHICGHREIYNRKTCPGNLDVDLLVSRVKDMISAEDDQNLVNDEELRVLGQLKEFEKEHKQADPGTNLEGSLNAAIGSYRELPKLQKKYTELDGQYQQEKTARVAATKETGNRLDQTWAELSPVGLEKNWPNVMGEIARLRHTEDVKEDPKPVPSTDDGFIAWLKKLFGWV